MISKNTHSADILIEGIYTRKEEILSFIYETYYPQVKTYIIKNKGTEEEAKDIFQNAILAIYVKVKDENLILTVKFNTYLLSICKKMWLNQLKRKKIISFEPLDDLVGPTPEIEISDDEVILETMNLAERTALYNKNFLELKKECQILLRMIYDNLPMEKIMEYLGLTSSEQLKKRKYRCKEYLIKSIKNDPLYNELF